MTTRVVVFLMTRITRVRNFSLTIGLAIAECSPAGDAKLRKAIFGPTADAETRVIDERVALSLGDGFFGRDRPDTAIGPKLTFAELCLDYGRIDLLREVLGARHPAAVGELNTSTEANWLAYLRSKLTGNFRGVYSLAASATTPIGPHSADFIELLIETGSETSGMEHAIKQGGPASAFITETLMRLRIRHTQAASPVALAPEQPSARRRAVGV
jgi:hypothetical protein